MLGELAASVSASPQEEAHLGRGLPGISFLGRTQKWGAALHHLLPPSSRVRIWVSGVPCWTVGAGCFEHRPTKGLNSGGVMGQHSTSNNPKVPGPQDTQGLMT